MKLSTKSVKKAIDWRIRVLLGTDTVDRVILKLGLIWRPVLRRPTFISIAGSVGKTTAKDLLVGILSKKGKVVGNMLSLNMAPEIAKIVLRVRPWHQFCVAELGETEPGSLDSMLDLLSPTIAVITTIGDDHLAAFGSRDAIASEIAKVTHSIPLDGTVVLNLDDERVMQMGNEINCHVITYGISENADLRAEAIQSVWPDPLQFTVTYKGQTLPIRTQIYGRQLLTSALAAIGGGLAAGLTLDECANGIQTVPPAEGRLQLVRCAGITFIRDDFKSPRWTIGPLIEQLAGARARRKIFVLGTISDTQKKEQEYVRIAQKALAASDLAIFTGRFASAALKARQPDNEHRLYAFTHIRDACAFIHTIHQAGDLIVLKGTNKKDHLLRVLLSFSEEVNCWIDDCKRDMFCSECSHLKTHHGMSLLTVSTSEHREPCSSPDNNLPHVGPNDQVVIGLGNPGPEYADTPHNVGYEAIDDLSRLMGIEWQEFPGAWIAMGRVATRDGSDRHVWLIKVKSPMNLTGPLLKKLADAMGFGAAQCILVFDDADYPLGKIKVRMNGSSGGHRGVASILDVFQTDKIRRLKIGVTTEDGRAVASEKVLYRFSAESLKKIKPTLQLAAKRIAELI